MYIAIILNRGRFFSKKGEEKRRGGKREGGGERGGGREI